ncbi:DUF2798 domain-containing protein [Paenibacillus gallinarum]|uniref:DUF2798 domain-containing protein n=1 Tax=Paenibacillus gallinarum TaxID=2762232 RepID=A0ABR8STB4_9BACL|nr:DUF2798 domain-containing protein [Paenibacillus gallinarum]MBD7966738.1 DUF2798 domain-containing protein [Paenibacillus gallinarum]
MPSNKKEGIIFGLMMCFGMVCVMFFYNMYLNGLLTTLPISGILSQFALTFVIAFLVESFIVGPIARKAAFSLPFDKSKTLYVILATSTCMVIGMVLCMSVYGLITSMIMNGIEGSILANYGRTILKNVIVAYPAQLLVIGPLVRFLFVKFVKDEPVVNLSTSNSSL